MQALWYEVVLGSIFWEVFCANFEVRSGTGKYFVQILFVWSSTGRDCVQIL